MKLITAEIDKKLRANGEARARGEDTRSTMPPLKLFYPAGAATWLISERDPDDPDLLFGLADLGQGLPELGDVRLSELEGFTGRFGLKIERDKWFEPTKTLVEYADEARAKGYLDAH